MTNIERLIAIQNVGIPVFDFTVNLLLTACLSAALSRLYIHYGRVLSNRAIFGENFIILSIATMLVITIVKSSLALSLGLVGALSIVRFRTAIKEPEELVYLFLCITIGVGMGANQRAVTLIGFFVLVLIAMFRSGPDSDTLGQNLHLVVKSRNPADDELENIVHILRGYCSAVNLKRFDEQAEVFESAFLIEIKDFAALGKMKTKLKEIRTIVQISFYDNQGVL